MKKGNYEKTSIKEQNNFQKIIIKKQKLNQKKKRRR
jgi:hypothetical protein